MDYKIAVIGDRESILGFKALGLETFPAGLEDAKRIFCELLSHRDKYAIIYVTEELASFMKAEIDGVKDSMIPAVIPVPSKTGCTGFGMNALAKAVERAVGANILEN
jgi:V/A-type H+-transporting ATPase subunit F